MRQQKKSYLDLCLSNAFTFFFDATRYRLWGSGDRTRVGRVSLFKIRLPCPDELTELQNWVQMWLYLHVCSTYTNVLYIFASALSFWLRKCIIHLCMLNIHEATTIFVFTLLGQFLLHPCRVIKLQQCWEGEVEFLLASKSGIFWNKMWINVQ